MKVYDPTEVTVTFAGLILSGFAEDTMISVEQVDDSFKDKAGVDGEVTRSKTSDRRATVTIHLMQSSESNALLSALHTADVETPGGAGVGALFIRDRQGTTLFHAEHAWIVKPPDVTLGKEPTAREWPIRCARLQRVDGGN